MSNVYATAIAWPALNANTKYLSQLVRDQKRATPIEHPINPTLGSGLPSPDADDLAFISSGTISRLEHCTPVQHIYPV